MKIGLVRHFKVNQKINKTFLLPEEFDKAIKEYDTCSVIPNELKLNSSDWDICYCSTLPRAITTAETIYNKEIIKTSLIVEVPISSFTKKKVKLPALAWQLGARIAWYKSHHSQAEDIHATRKRIEKFYNLISNSGHKNILVVAHGYFLKAFEHEIKKKGFSGNVELNIKNGKLYILEL
ncbi:MAG: phosphoglycerate mutase family protein [Melioribacteraceae bacterium]